MSSRSELPVYSITRIDINSSLYMYLQIKGAHARTARSVQAGRTSAARGDLGQTLAH